MKWYLQVLKKYAVFSGRAQRSEYWFFVLFNFIISLVLTVIGMALSDPAAQSFSAANLLSLLYTLAVLIPSLAVTIRRLHDTGRSGWWLLMALVPIVGGIVLLVFFVQDSQPGANKFGENPKGA